MEKMSKYDEFIQPFLDGELSREELDWFSKELESNAVLAEDIRLYREVDNAIREQDVMDLRDQLDVIHNSIGDPAQAPAAQTRYRKVLSYAAIASLAILISLGVLLKVQHNKLTLYLLMVNIHLHIAYILSLQILDNLPDNYKDSQLLHNYHHHKKLLYIHNQLLSCRDFHLQPVEIYFLSHHSIVHHQYKILPP